MKKKKVWRITRAGDLWQYTLAPYREELKQDNSMPAIIPSPPETTCSKCMVTLDTEALKCNRCSVLMHLRCSDLPMYLLLRYKTSQAQYICRACVLGEGNPESLKEAQVELTATIEREKNAINAAALEDTKDVLVDEMMNPAQTMIVLKTKTVHHYRS